MIATQANQDSRSGVSRPYSSSVAKGEYPLPPANLTLQCANPPHLKYNITVTDSGVVLSIWEPAPKNEERVKPFLFMTRHRLANELEAKKLLAHYLSVYKLAATSL